MSAPEKPGDILRSWILSRGWTQKTLAEVVDRPQQWVSEVISGKKAITVRSAMELAIAFDNTPGYWLAMQDRYRLWELSRDAANTRRLSGVRERARQQAPKGLD